MAIRALHRTFPCPDAWILSLQERPVNREIRPLFCAQIVSKNHQEYQNISKDIELYRNPGAFKSRPISLDIHYFLHFSFFRGFLHTVEVRGSSPLSPTNPILWCPPVYPQGTTQKRMTHPPICCRPKEGSSGAAGPGSARRSGGRQYLEDRDSSCSGRGVRNLSLATPGRAPCPRP